MIIAAGILFRSAAGTILLMKRSGAADYQSTWGLPGGKVEGEETLADAAIRETLEETAYEVDTAGQVHTRRVSGDVDFTTFIKDVPEEFVPTLNEEHTSFAWMTPDDALQQPNLHPGVIVCIQRLSMDELGIARAMSYGELASPERYENVMLVDMRITGTGVSYRRALNEFVYRRPENYLTPEFLARCNGLPVIMMHPEKSILDSKEFSDRIVGTMLLPYIKGDEVWGIAKIYDDTTMQLIETKQIGSTSPAVVFRDQTVNSKMTLEDGSSLLIEGKPSLLDHLAICERGVWDKGQEPLGIRTDSNGESKMTEEEIKAKADADEKAKADAMKADSEKLDKVLASLDSMSKICDSLSKRMDAMESDPVEVAADRKDGEGEESEEEKKAKKDAEEAEEKEKADKAKKDAEEEEEKRKADSAEVRKMIADVAAKLPKALSDADYAALADAQARADSVFNAFGQRAPRPLDGETLPAYERRLTTVLKVHSPTWKSVPLEAIADDAAFAPIQKQIYADAMEAAAHPADLGAGELREVTTTNHVTGQRMTRFLGKNTFIHAMKRPARRATIVPPVRH